MTNKNILRRNLISILAPMLLSVLGLGLLTTVIIFRYINSDLRRSNTNMLDTFRNNIELLIMVMDQYMYNFSSNPAIIARTKAIFSLTNFSYAEYQNSLFINSIINTPVFTYPYLHSAYIFYNGYDKVLCSDIGLVSINEFYDRDWLEAISTVPFPNEPTRFWRREIRPYDFEKSTRVITLNRALYSPGIPKSDGLIVLNFDAHYILETLQSLAAYEGQLFLAVNFRKEIVLSNIDPASMVINPEEMARIQNRDNGGWSLIAGKRYRVYKTELAKCGLVFMSLVPLLSSYKLAEELIIITLIVMIIVTVIGVTIALVTTRRERGQLVKIIQIFSDFETSGTFPVMDGKAAAVSNIYDYIIYNILGIFLRNHQMKLQLQERKYQRDLYELKALQAQINPHFLYNVLETINWKTMELAGGYSIVNEMIENLSRILKYCLSKAEAKTTLKDEIEYTKRYMAIQNIRYDHEVHVRWEYREDDLDIRVVKLIFQPFIENAMKHGGLSHTRDVEIAIRIICRENHLCISIADNGAGMDTNRLMEVRTSLAHKWQDDAHIGLINTNQRLRLLYGETCSIKIFSRKNMGTTVFLILPIEHANLPEHKNI